MSGVGGRTVRRPEGRDPEVFTRVRKAKVSRLNRTQNKSLYAAVPATIIITCLIRFPSTICHPDIFRTGIECPLLNANNRTRVNVPGNYKPFLKLLPSPFRVHLGLKMMWLVDY